MTGRCPSELALEGFLLEPGRSSIAGHVAACARCAQRLAQMRAEGEEFDRWVFPATVDAVEARADPRPWWRRAGILLPIPALAAVAAAVVLLRPIAPPPDYVGTKGSALGLTVYALGPGGVTPVPDGERVAPDGSIRFRVRGSAPCWLRILSVDGSGAVSRLFPAEGSDGRVEAGQRDVPGGAVLDGRPGPERIYALCTPDRPGWPELERSVRAAVAPPASARAPRPLGGLPAGAGWSSVLLEKTP